MKSAVENASRVLGEALDSMPEESTRRMLLTVGGVAALALFSSKAEAQTTSAPGFEVEASWVNPLNRLVRRVTYGFNPTEVLQVNKL